MGRVLIIDAVLAGFAGAQTPDAQQTLLLGPGPGPATGRMPPRLRERNCDQIHRNRPHEGRLPGVRDVKLMAE